MGERIGEVRLVTGAYEALMEGRPDGGGGGGADKETGRRIRVAGGKYWDVLLYVLPKGA